MSRIETHVPHAGNPQRGVGARESDPGMFLVEVIISETSLKGLKKKKNSQKQILGTRDQRWKKEKKYSEHKGKA